MIGGAVAVPGTSSVVGLTGSTGSTTFVLVALLVALGLAMVVTAVWLVRSTRSDAPALGPLEVMGDRRFSKAQPEARRARLTEVRPEGAPPPAPMIPYEGDEHDEADRADGVDGADAEPAAPTGEEPVTEEPVTEEPIAEEPVSEDR